MAKKKATKAASKSTGTSKKKAPLTKKTKAASKKATTKAQAIKDGTIAAGIRMNWGGITTLDQREYTTVAELRAWMEQEMGDIENALEFLDADDDANPWTYPE